MDSLTDEQLGASFRRMLVAAAQLNYQCFVDISGAVLAPDDDATVQDMVDVFACHIRPVLDTHLVEVLHRYEVDPSVIKRNNMGDRLLAYGLVDLFVVLAGQRLPAPSANRAACPVETEVVPLRRHHHCAACGKMTGLKKCSGCGVVWYCSKECQVSHWRAAHKSACARNQPAV